MTQATVRKSNVEQDSTWKTCFSCDATYYGATCSKCDADANRWQSALRRAIDEAVDILTEPISGETFAESSNQPGVLYVVTRTSCTCAAGRQEKPCKHRAAFLCQLGELELQDDRIQFFGDADRQEIRIDGRFFGNALFTDEGGWQLFRGAFPRARQMGSYCTLEEIRTDLMASAVA